jgi:hypothetical protein
MAQMKLKGNFEQVLIGNDIHTCSSHDFSGLKNQHSISITTTDEMNLKNQNNYYRLSQQQPYIYSEILEAVRSMSSSIDKTIFHLSTTATIYKDLTTGTQYRFDYVFDISKGPSFQLKKRGTDINPGANDTTSTSLVNLSNIALCDDGVIVLDITNK